MRDHDVEDDSQDEKVVEVTDDMARDADDPDEILFGDDEVEDDD